MKNIKQGKPMTTMKTGVPICKACLTSSLIPVGIIPKVYHEILK